ncbi:1,4-alpha-glucan branching enzyme [Anabaena sp. FACHB-709]|uniref:1,4-alpha-glucan branching enzyme GlgB n=3 Tax=Nostocaceae TaxID=1162 RepID=GLGB_NOSS1|nr:MULTISPECIES: 1,4-alpha-glucan branching enzyme [Nostocaceae]Q8YYX9.1 RecName: Full=1,4-alpha-glucan branching enzyme GlgB; AltName: Full=1,4-alpha-D-glucan:1,4-alpha-D-glucan 6-glucosyl-transferase; AltName: Full=Alpha-(1->4)-glucan branching enzyme; AltName: Full=Glycogen branching enzyme; Short=BE [Nostoc sp. PCC 7120 = FACHB-418]BAY71688.1 1,4-alpha-glucan branching enzyme [Trichormus variabilis NIES-23]MBD2172534.1 1,4-alpha-glucan branching enzyme [Anabaena cylindrica FACHB-318]MBD2264
MSMTTIAPEQVNRIVWNQHHDPFEILGSHPIEQNGKTVWVVRAYLPNASAAWVVLPEQRQEYPMQTVHDPHFFECIIETSELSNYQLKTKEGEHERVSYDPYAFRSPRLTDFDLHLFAEGNHHRIYEKLGAHFTEVGGVKGVYFAVWAPNARNVSVLGDFNLWDGRKHQMRKGATGVWELFIPEIGVGEHYKYEIKNFAGHIYEKSDPFGFQQEPRPKTASIVSNLNSYNWSDEDWLEQRRHTDPLTQPISVYEVHLGSWLHAASAEPAQLPNGETEPVVIASELNPGARFLTYRELASRLIPYVKELGYTHIELLPIAEHPFDGSWGYQVTGYYAPTSRFGTPEDFMYFVDQCHQNNIGVLVDWVPGHFPKDGHGLAFFDGTHLYEHADPRKGEHKEWGTLVFNYSRNEVRNFLVANALFWFDKYHIDGIRVDAVASMLYLDYCRKEGEWLPNQYGGRENLEAADFLRQVNHLLFSYFPGVLSIAEESTDWPMVSWPTYTGGLGFNLKWNMGWMHDMLDYFSMDPWFRQFHQNNITFSMWYNHSENFMLALSHDEVVHGKSNIIGKMPGDKWQKLANVRCLFAYMFAHPGKKTMFMSMEFGQWSEWNVWADLEWPLLQFEPHQQLKKFFTELNKLYRSEPALYTLDFAREGFDWIDCSDNRHSVVSFIRREKDTENFVVVICNFTPQPHSHYRIGVPEKGFYTELFNSDARQYGGSNMGNLGGKWTDDWSMHNRPYSLDLCLPPLGVLILKMDKEKTAKALGS